MKEDENHEGFFIINHISYLSLINLHLMQRLSH
jgi:hypothetical protein